MIEITPTAVSHDARELLACAEAIHPFASSIHIDVDDGVFAPHVTWPYTTPGTFEPFDLSKLLDLLIEVHLMVEEPREIGIAFAHAGAGRILGHIEAFADANEALGALDVWKKAGADEVGLGMLLDTPLPVLEPLIAACDYVHMMSIATIGVQGIPYEPRAVSRIQELHARYPELLISVDGGVSEKNITDLVRAGARRFGVGSAIAKASDPKAAYQHLKSIAESALE